MQCKRCGSAKVVKSGMVRGKQRYLCRQCGFHFVEGDQRGYDDALFLKILCKLFQALGCKKYSTIARYLKRDKAQVFRWMHEEAFDHKCCIPYYSTECYNSNGLFSELKDSGIDNREPMLLTENKINDLYVAVIVQRRDKKW